MEFVMTPYHAVAREPESSSVHATPVVVFVASLAPSAVDAQGHLELVLPVGAHLVTPRTGYNHHGIYVGHDRVVHYSGFCRGLHRGPVEESTVAQFSGGNEVWVEQGAGTRYSGDEVAHRARSRLGENRYRLLTNNCEHFCAWCLDGISRSEQVRQYFRHPAVAVRMAGSLLMAWIGFISTTDHGETGLVSTIHYLTTFC
jgi:hypothetical protein